MGACDADALAPDADADAPDPEANTEPDIGMADARGVAAIGVARPSAASANRSSGMDANESERRSGTYGVIGSAHAPTPPLLLALPLLDAAIPAAASAAIAAAEDGVCSPDSKL